MKVSGLRIELGGQLFGDQELPASEAIGVVLAIIVLLIAFGSVLAAGLPILTALFGIGLASRSCSSPPTASRCPTTTQAVAMIGIGVGIDYALIVTLPTRRCAAISPREAVAAYDAGRSVVFAGTTVVIAVLGMLLINVPAVQGLAIGIALGVLMTMLAAITLLPAVLGFVGHNIDKLGLRTRNRRGEVRESFWYRWSRFLQRRPWPAAIAGVVILVVLALPVLSMRLAFADADRPTSDDTAPYDLLVEGFEAGFNGPMILAIDMPGGRATSGPSSNCRSGCRTRGVAFATPPQTNEDGNAARSFRCSRTARRRVRRRRNWWTACGTT